MEVIDVPGHPGKFEVLFNNVSISCFSDTDCPGAGICAINASWSLQPGGWCMCNSKYGFSGLKCNEWCAQGVAVLICTIIGGILELFVASAALYYICLILWSHRFERIVSPVFVALAMVFLGSSLTLVGAISTGVTICGFASHYEIVMDPAFGGSLNRELRRPSKSLELAASIVSIIGYCLSMCSVVILPLTWVAQRSLQLRKTQTNLVICLSVGFAIIILAVMLTIYILAAFNYQAGISWSLGGVIGWEVILTTVLIVNVIAFVRISHLKKAATTNRHNSHEISYNGQTNDDRTNMNLLLRRIQIACGVLAIPLIMIMVLMPFSHVRAQRGFYTDPRCYVDSLDILTRCSIFFVMLACAAVVWFVAPHARGLAKTAVAARQSSVPGGAHSRDASRLSSNRYPQNTAVRDGTSSRRDSKESKENVVDQSHRSEQLDNSAQANGENEESPPSSCSQKTPPNSPPVLKRRPNSIPLTGTGVESKNGLNSSTRRVIFGDEQQQQRKNGVQKDNNVTTQSGTLTLT